MTSAAKWFKQKPPKVKWERIYKMVNFDVPDVKWVERIVVGSSNPTNPLTEAEIAQQIERVNRELRYGMIVSVETNINKFNVEGREVLGQYTVYHIGYKSRPHGK